MNLLSGALGYARLLRWPVFPVHSPRGEGGTSFTFSCSCGHADCENVAKHPRIVGWQQAATTDEGCIREWWKRWPDANIGLPTGEPIGAWVLDVDPRHGGDETLRNLEAKNGELPLTVRQLTGGGGVHYLFSLSDGLVVGNRVRFAEGLDTRSTGGLIVAAPSLHICGKRYAWDVDAHPTEVAIAPAPGWLLELVGEKPEAKKSATPTEEWVRIVNGGAVEGERNHTVVRLAGHLLRRDINAHVVLGLVLAWNEARCRPPLPDAEVTRTVDNVCGFELRRRKGSRA